MSLLLFTSCEERARLNPLDPLNEETNGAPIIGTIMTDRNTVTLAWEEWNINNLLGYRLVRTNPLEDSDERWIPAGTALLIDSNLIYDQPYTYTLQAITTFDSSATSDPVDIIPGPWNIWYADYYNYSVSRLSYDAGQVLANELFVSPIAVAVDRAVGTAFVADYWNQAIYFMSLNLDTVKAELTLSGKPRCLDIDRENQQIYLITRDDSVTYLINFNYVTEQGSAYELPFTVETSSGFAVEKSTSVIWITGVNGNVYRCGLVPLSSSVLVKSYFIGNNPLALEIDQSKGICWVGSDSNLVKINPDDSIDTVRTDFSVFSLSVNPNNGDCFYTGHDNTTDIWETRKITAATGTDELFLGASYPDIGTLKVVPNGEKSGLVAFQYYTWKILRFDAGGELIGEVDDVNGNIRFALE